ALRRGLPGNGNDAQVRQEAELLQLHLRAGGLELLLDLLGLGLGDAFLDRLRGALDQVLGLLEAQAGDRAHFLDRADLVGAAVDEDDVELGLLLGGRGGGGAGGGSGGGRDRSGGGDAPLRFEVLDQAGDFEDRLAGEPLDDLFFGDVAHGIWGSVTSVPGWVRLRDESPSGLLWMFGFRVPAGAGAKMMVGFTWPPRREPWPGGR